MTTLVSILLLTILWQEGFTEASSNLKVDSKYEDKFYCLSDDGTNIPSEERILVLSPNDYYFYNHAHLENLAGKYFPATKEKTFSNVVIVNGILHDKNGGKKEVHSKLQILDDYIFACFRNFLQDLDRATSNEGHD